MHPSITQVLKFFEYKHLPEKLQAVSQPFWALAQSIADRTCDDGSGRRPGHMEKPADGIETTVALRKLLEAKDAAVRAAL